MNIFQNFFQLSKQKGHSYHINLKINFENFAFTAVFAWRVTIGQVFIILTLYLQGGS